MDAILICLCNFQPTAAARALMDSELSAEEVARKAMNVAADMCVYTNHQFLVEVIDAKEPTEEGES
jgi:ATP-dependent HslUV protease subunit HslV